MAYRSESALGSPEPGERIIAALLVACLVAALGWSLLSAFAVTLGLRPAEREIAVVLLPAAAPSPPIETRTPARQPRRQAAAAAAPRNRHAEATPLVAPPLPIPAPPSPVVTAPVPGTGAAASAGASDLPGSGSGSGGQGDGSGGGGSGDSDGGSDSVQIGGRIKESDYPRAALAARVSGTVYLRFTVGITGRVTACTVTRTSGDAKLDEATCRLIVQRFRFRPATDARGRPVPDELTGEHHWVMPPRPQEP